MPLEATRVEDERAAMVAQMRDQGIEDERVLQAMSEVPRHAFVPEGMEELAYDDAPLSIGTGQTISQPFMVALMLEALQLRPQDKVLEVGAGSGYAAAVLSKLVAQVYTMERYGVLANEARQRLSALGYHNVQVRRGDGSKGWPDAAPFDAIVVAAGAREPPQALLAELAVGGRMVVPVGDSPREQRLLRVTRTGASEFKTEELGAVVFVPLVAREGWRAPRGARPPRPSRGDTALSRHAEPFVTIEDADLEPLLERVGDARVVLLGEASHGTDEFYRMRARITEELIQRKGFDVVAVEADWPDAKRIDDHVRHLQPRGDWEAFARFPVWMWRNEVVHDFVAWLRDHNRDLPGPERVAFLGLDVYSLDRSIQAVLEYLDERDPEAAKVARMRYACFSPWQASPQRYGHLAASSPLRSCQEHVVQTLSELLQKEETLSARDGAAFFDAAQNARVVAGAEAYYRAMYEGTRSSWNVRDSHMFQTLQNILARRGPDSKVVVWAHNSHLGDASATEMGRRGEHNLGQLCRQHFGDAVYNIGFGTDHGTVTAADDWGSEAKTKQVRPARLDSHERLMHETRIASFLLPLKDEEVRHALRKPRLERAIGVIYRPETELQSHYFRADLTSQFDEWIWFDETHAVQPLPALERTGVPETYPFGV